MERFIWATLFKFRQRVNQAKEIFHVVEIISPWQQTNDTNNLSGPASSTPAQYQNSPDP